MGGGEHSGWHVESLGRLQEGRGVIKWRSSMHGSGGGDDGDTRPCPAWYPLQWDGSAWGSGVGSVDVWGCSVGGTELGHYGCGRAHSVPPSFVEPQPVMKHLAPSWKM